MGELLRRIVEVGFLRQGRGPLQPAGPGGAAPSGGMPNPLAGLSDQNKKILILVVVLVVCMLLIQLLVVVIGLYFARKKMSLVVY